MLKRIIKIFVVIIVFVGLGTTAFYLYLRHQQGQPLGVKDPNNGQIMVCDEVDITVDKSVNESSIQQYAKDLGGRVGQSIPAINVYSILLPAKCNSDAPQIIYKAINYLKTKPGINSAEPDYYGHLD